MRTVLSISVVFVFAFCTGVVAVLISTGALREAGSRAPLPRTGATSPGGRVEVGFREWTVRDGDLVALVDMANTGLLTVRYRRYPGSDGSARGAANPVLKRNGVEVNEFRCGTGQIVAELAPGAVITNVVSGAWLAQHWDDGQRMRIGFYYSALDRTDPEPVWTEDIPVPEEVRRKLGELKRR
jgi:hypothetical protein